MARLDRPAPLQLDTPIRAGSISKVVTAIAVQQLAEAGGLTLDGEIQSYVDWELPFGYGRATIRELLTHRAGVGERFSRQSTADAQEIADLSGYLESQLPPPVARLGETVSYSNFGISLVGLAIEHVAEQSFDLYASEHIFKPLGLVTAKFIPGPELEGRQSSGYNWVFGRHRELPLRHWKPYPASSLVASPGQLAKLMQCLLEGGSPILGRAEELFVEQATAVAGVPGMGLSFWLDSIMGQPVAWHTGHMPGHRTGFYIFPSLGIGIVLYYNTDEKVLRGFLDRLCAFAFGEVQGPSGTKRQARQTVGREFLGTYRHSWYPHHHFGKCSVLTGMEGEEVRLQEKQGLLSVNGESYVQVSDDVFVSLKRQTRLGFLRDENGAISGLYTGGRDRYERLAWWETVMVQLAFAGTSLACFVWGGVTLIVQLFTGHTVTSPVTAWSLLFLCGFNSGFAGALILLTALGAYRMTQDLPSPVRMALALPVMGSGACGVAILSLAFQDSGYSMPPLGVGMLSLLVLAETAFIASLNYWRLLGWRYR